MGGDERRMDDGVWHQGGRNSCAVGDVGESTKLVTSTNENVRKAH